VSDDPLRRQGRSGPELQIPVSPGEEDDAESSFFAPPRPPSDFSIMMMLPRRSFWKSRAFAYTVAGLLAGALLVALSVSYLSRPGPTDWLEGRWVYAGEPKLDVRHEFQDRKLSTYIDGVWALSVPYRIIGAGSDSLVVQIGEEQSVVRFEGEDRMTIETAGEAHPYARAP
jgi:hypothetical protein